jgi:hypothetical protein
MELVLAPQLRLECLSGQLRGTQWLRLFNLCCGEIGQRLSENHPERYTSTYVSSETVQFNGAANCCPNRNMAIL